MEAKNLEDGYDTSKVQDPNTWKLKHIVIWEKTDHCQGHAIIFADGNRENLDIDNLILVSRRQLLILNQHRLIQDNAELLR